MNIVDKLIQRIDRSKGLPALEGTVSEILSTLYDKRHDPAHLVKLITDDVSLTQRVLKLANSPMYSSFSHGIDSISQALHVLGDKAITHLALSALVITEDELYHDKELSKALLASTFAKSISDSSEKAAVVTLLYNIGKLFITRYLDEEATSVEEHISKGMLDAEAETAVLGMTYKEIGVILAKRWHLPDTIVSVLDGTGDQTLITIAKSASHISHLVYERQVDEVARYIQASVIPARFKQQLASIVEEKNIVVATKAAKKQQAKESMIEKLRELHSKVKAKRFPHIERLADEVFYSLFSILDLNSILLLSSCDHVFSVKYGISDTLERHTKEFVLKHSDGPNAFQAAISNNIFVNIRDIGKLRDDMLPKRYKELFPTTKRFIVLPIDIEGSVEHVLYLDWDKAGLVTADVLLVLTQLHAEFKRHC